MDFLNKLERKLGKYAIQNLTFWLIGTWVLGFIIQYTMPEVQSLLLLASALILRGQVWRIISWLLVPPSVNILFLIFFLSCYYFIGTSIEQAIGTFRYNVYLIGGMLCSILGAFLLYGFYYFAKGIAVSGVGYYFSTEYITMSLFMAFAVIYPNVEFRLYFIIPIKAKWMGIVDAVWMIFMFLGGNAASRTAILASLMNFLIFFFSTRNYKRVSPRKFTESRYTGSKCARQKVLLGINVRSVAERNGTVQSWNSGSAQNVMAITNIVRSIYLHISISNIVDVFIDK